MVAAGGGGADVSSGGSAGYPSGASGGVGTFPGPGGGGTATSGGSGGAYDSFHGSAGAGFTAAGPGSGGNGTELGGGGGAGYYGGGGGTLNSGGGGGSDYCDASVSDCQASLASSGPSVTIQYLAPQSITFPSTAVTYRQADFSPASSDSGLQVSYSNPSGQCSIDSGGLLQITGAGSCTVTADQAGNDEYEPATSVTQTLQINPAVVHVDADAASVGYGQPDPAASGTLRVGDFVNGDTAATSAITGAASCSIASHAQNAGTYTGAITCQPGTLASPNYTFTTGNSADLTITQAVVHVDADPASMTYGQSDPSASGTLRSADFVNGDTAAASAITGSASCSIGSHSPNTGSYTGAITCQPGTLASPNYTFTTGNSADLTITQAVVHVDADPASMTYGQSDPSASGTLRSADFVNGDTAAASAITGSASCSIGSHSPNTGSYTGAITCEPGTLASPNYTFTTGNSADLTVNRAVVHVDADAASVGYGQPDPAASGTLRVGDFVNGDTAATSAITGAASCSIASHAQNAGTYTGAITCQPGTLASPNYTFTTGNSADLTISQAVVHVDADPASMTYGQSDPSASGTLRSADFVNGDTAAASAITGSASCSIGSHSPNTGSYTGAITCQPGTLASPNYTFTTGNAADLTIDAPPPSSAPTPPPSRTPVEPVAPVKPVVPNLLSVELTTHTVRWSSNDRFPRLWLTFTLSNPATVHLALQVRERGRWQALKSITVSAAAGHDGVQLVGLWQGALVPARHLRLIVRARTAAGRSAARILTFTVVHGHVRPVH